MFVGQFLGSRRSAFVLVLAVVVMISGTQVLLAHDGHKHAHNHKTVKHANGHQVHGLILPDIDGPKPWSEKPALTDEMRFNFAVVTDRTGGHRPGIWMKAIHRLNWMRPQFVVSVGDLIEGYTTKRDEVEAQWKEFLGFIDQLEMKFFFVPGNHDVTNPLMQKIWREHFGRAWYSFDYKGVHFVCLNSEDPEAHLGEEQLAWVEKDLAKHSDARWTMIFLHKPLWTHAEAALAVGNPDKTNWTRLTKLLGDRPHTVFAGHTHHYMQYKRGEYYYFNLATTGGGSRLRGEQYGEFDHVAWVTMEEDGPRVANLKLDGILPGNVVAEELSKSFAKYLKSTQFRIRPILVQGSMLKSGKIEFLSSNSHTTPVNFSVQVHGLPQNGLMFEANKLNWTVKPGESAKYEAEFRLSEPVSLERFRKVFVTVRYVSQDDVPMQAEMKTPLLIGKALTLERGTRQVDGNLDDWDKPLFMTKGQLQTTGATKQWQGSKDGSFAFSSCYDDRNVYVGVRVYDDKLVKGDKMTIVIDARDLEDRLNHPTLNLGSTVITLTPPDDDGKFKLDLTGGALATSKSGRRVKGGYEVEWSMPIAPIYALQGRNWSSIQIGAQQVDVDEANEQPVFLNWQVGEKFTKTNDGLIHVFRKTVDSK